MLMDVGYNNTTSELISNKREYVDSGGNPTGEYYEGEPELMNVLIKPTIAHALDFLYNKYDIDIDIIRNIDTHKIHTEYYFMFEIYDIENSIKMYNDGAKFEFKEEAYMNAIEKSLRHVIQKTSQLNPCAEVFIGIYRNSPEHKKFI